MSGGKLYRAKLQPFRLLMLLLWGEHSFADWAGDTVCVRPTGLSRVFRVSHGRLYGYLEWLQEKGYVRGLSRDTKKQFCFTVVRPGRWTDV